MFSSSICAIFLTLLSAATAIPAPLSPRAITTPQAVYLLNNLEENGVVSYKVNEDGSLSEGTVTSTRGAGARAIIEDAGAAAGPDALFSQHALTLADDYLYAVNAGDNTVSVLQIDPLDPTKLNLVGTPSDTLGDFPNSVAVSLKWRQVCVSNTGAAAGIACASFDRRSGLSIMDKLRPTELGQKTPPVGPANTFSQLFFNEAEDRLYATVKGASTDEPGFFASWSIDQFKVGDTEQRSTPEGTGALAGAVNIPDSTNILAADASLGVAVLSIADGVATTIAAAPIGGQVATSHVAMLDTTGTAFVGDNGRNVIFEVEPASGEQVAAYIPDADGPGFTDIATGGDLVYALFPGNETADAHIQILDLSEGKGKGKGVQSFVPSGLEAGRAVGLVAFSGRL